MEVYRWRFKNLSQFWILVRTFTCVKLVICMFLLNRYHHKLIDNSYSNVKIVQNVMVIWQLAKLWIILALKFSELLLQLFVLYRLVVQQNAKVDIYLNEKVFCSGSSDFLFTELIFEIKAGTSGSYIKLLFFLDKPFN